MATLIITEGLDNISTITQRFVPSSSRYHFHSGKLKTTAAGQWQRCGPLLDWGDEVVGAALAGGTCKKASKMLKIKSIDMTDNTNNVPFLHV